MQVLSQVCRRCLLALTWMTYTSALVCILALGFQLYQFIYKQTVNLSSNNEDKYFTSEAERSLRFVNALASSGSSVWCHGNNHTDRTCKFHNLCYMPHDKVYLFFHGPETITSGVPENRFDPALVGLSSVADHNANFFHYEDVPAGAAQDILLPNSKVVEGTTLLFNRFLPDNIMHVLHDDLIPLYHTLKMVDRRHYLPSNVQLLFTDVHEADIFDTLYLLLTESEPRHISEQSGEKTDAHAICFHESWVGLRQRTTWYQYGFTAPQGPLVKAVTAMEIKQFTGYLTTRVRQGERQPETTDSGLFVLVSRKETRLILNEMQLCLAMANTFHKKIISVSLETHSVQELINIIGRAELIIGMHGSMLVLSMFLPPGALLIELFPYAVPPENYTPYKSLAEIHGMGIVYRSWKNMDPTKSSAHPDNAPERGGISHLDPELQDEIQNSDEVPEHLCCSDPEWLFRINQDTLVNVDEIVNLISGGLIEANEHKKDSDPSGLTHSALPGRVRDLHCAPTCYHGQEFGDTTNKICLMISWKSPWNFDYLKNVKIHSQYDIWIQSETDDEYKPYNAKDEELYLSEPWLVPSTVYLIWVRATTSKGHGIFSFTTCKIG